MSYDYINLLSQEARKRYDVKLAAVGLTDCPYQMPADSWTDEPTQWPNVQWPDVMMYLIDTAGIFTHEAMKNYRSTEAHRYFTAGFVETVRHCVTSNGSVVFRAGVRPSQRGSDPSHQPWVATDKDGVVLAGHCTCMAGLGESCSHVAAVLFKIETAVRLGLTTMACTSRPCEWNNFYTAKVQPARIRDIKLYGDNSVSRVVATGRESRAENVSSTDEEQRSFLQTLAAEETPPVALSLFGETSERFRCQRTAQRPVSLPKPLRDWYHEENTAISEEELTKKASDIADSLQISPAQVDFVEEQTRAQSRSAAWYEQRPGHITASFAHTVSRTNQDSPAPSVVKGVTTMPRAPVMSKALQYGRDNEDDAFRAYQEVVTQHHKNGQVRKTGMRVKQDQPWLSATADGVVTCDCHGSFVLEIKCPYSARQRSCTAFMADESSYIFNGKLNHDHAYYTQVQVQMEVYGVTQCAFMVKLNDGFILSYISKDELFLQDLLPKLEAFWRRHIVKELLTRSVENFEKPSHPPKDDTPYCYCKQLWQGGEVMVGCDGVNCPHNGWVHLACIRPRRKTVPKNTWYCKDCKKHE